MAKTKPTLAFQDTAPFEANLATFATYLAGLDADLAEAATPLLSRLSEAAMKREEVLDNLMAALLAAEVKAAASKAGGSPAEEAPPSAPVVQDETPEAPPTPGPVQIGWFLEQLEIEGFRGVNNEGAPLVLKFKPDAVSSISAPNGVGKSSIFDALTFALRKSIPKLDNLAATERGRDYYLNRFHTGGVGTIALTVKPTDGSPSTKVTVTLDGAGTRTVNATNGIDGEALLAELHREFVLLDGTTFQRFIDDTSLSRGRNFAGLLGLARYSTLRGALDTLANTRSFNNHLDRSAVLARRDAADKAIRDLDPRIAADYEALMKTPLEPAAPQAEIESACHGALQSIPALAQHCDGKAFGEIDLDACIQTIVSEEGGEKKTRHSELVRKRSELTTEAAKGPSDDDVSVLADIVARRDAAVALTSGDLLNELYRVTEKVLTSGTWATPNTCPACERPGDGAVLDLVQARIADYEKVDEETKAAVTAWTTSGWLELSPLFAAHLDEAEAAQAKELGTRGAKGELSAAEFADLSGLRLSLAKRLKALIEEAQTEMDELAKVLPPSLVAATTAIETARRLQTAWRDVAQQQTIRAAAHAHETRTARLKTFVDGANTAFAVAESAMATERLEKVLPVCRDLFKAIMGQSVVPALAKRPGTEELAISLSAFWSLQDVSAQALLSESFRNGFAVSVYLAAASLYGGAPKFMILDDVTSSLDAGHQLNLIDVIRLQFARPRVADGPQIILLSHDTMLEKLFNAHNGSTEWQHQRLEGSPQMAVLPQSGAINKVRDGTNDLLNQGRAADAAPFIRQYLEYQLGNIITRCKIPVPFDVAFNDDQKMVGRLLAAIQEAVKLHKKAGDLVLDPGQEAALEQRGMTISSNFISHWATGSTSAYSAVALQTVMSAIDALQDCFMHQPDPARPKAFYRSLSQK
ncbi:MULTISPECIES: AAA family ATPase [Brevundimonas]|uniref:AAA family ATPase n=1 Tax=Brevundimonas TaxID=41275 RepID=UPI0025BF484A|nr:MULTISPECIES: AAA family ATPase [Brevundimonas]